MKTCISFCLLLVLLFGTAPARGQKFTLNTAGVTVKGELTTAITTGVGIRTSNQSPSLIGTSFGSDGKPKGGTGADITDDGDLNFKKGDAFSAPTKIFSRLSLSGGRYSMVVSTRAWVDSVLKAKNVPQGNTPGLDAYNETLSDTGFTDMNKFTNIIPWEAYATVHFANESSLTVGRQSVNWSAAKFFLNASHLNSIDINAVDNPGALLDREMDIPIGMIDVKHNFRSGLGVEAFYQLEHRIYNLPGCGTFFSGVNIGFDPSCSGLVANQFTGTNALNLPASDAVWDNSAYSLAHGYVIPRIADKLDGEHTQGGIALRYSVKPLKLDLSLYILNLASRTPIVAALASDDPSAESHPVQGLLDAGAPIAYAAFTSELQSIRYLWDYPGDTRTFGANATTTIKGWQTSTEAEYSSNQPIPINPPDILTTLVGGATPLTPRMAAIPEGGFFRGYDRLHNVKATVNAVHVFPSVLKARQLVVVAEAQDSAISNLPSESEARYGRGFQWGFSTQGFGGMAACGATVHPLSGNITGCINNGFVTANAVGYRTHFELSYAAGHNWTLSPSATWMHDVRGYSADTQLVEGRGVLSPALEWKMKQKYVGGIAFTAQALDSTYNTMQDRSYITIWSGVNF